LLIVVFMLVVPLHAAAQEFSTPDALEWGWWSRTLNGQLPPPPTVPSDGLAVGASADGPTMMSAVRVATGQSSAPVLELRAARELDAQPPSVLVCPAEPNWKPARGGRWQDRPDNSCFLHAVPLIRRAGQPVWYADLVPILDGEADVVSVAILPDPFVARSAPFELHFQRPAVRSDAPVVRPAATSAPVPRDGAGPANARRHEQAATPAPRVAAPAFSAPRVIATTQWGRRAKVTGYVMEVPMAAKGGIAVLPGTALVVARIRQLRRRRGVVPAADRLHGRTAARS
jgi:hypothetical protein